MTTALPLDTMLSAQNGALADQLQKLTEPDANSANTPQELAKAYLAEAHMIAGSAVLSCWPIFMVLSGLVTDDFGMVQQGQIFDNLPYLSLGMDALGLACLGLGLWLMRRPAFVRSPKLVAMPISPHQYWMIGTAFIAVVAIVASSYGLFWLHKQGVIPDRTAAALRITMSIMMFLGFLVLAVFRIQKAVKVGFGLGASS